MSKGERERSGGNDLVTFETETSLPAPSFPSAAWK